MTQCEEFQKALITPTAAQLFTCFVLTYYATKFYLPVFIVRVDERTGEIFFLAGEELGISIFQDGTWRYL